jgi:hypothetical protein
MAITVNYGINPYIEAAAYMGALQPPSWPPPPQPPSWWPPPPQEQQEAPPPPAPAPPEQSLPPAQPPEALPPVPGAPMPEFQWDSSRFQQDAPALMEAPPAEGGGGLTFIPNPHIGGPVSRPQPQMSEEDRYRQDFERKLNEVNTAYTIEQQRKIEDYQNQIARLDDLQMRGEIAPEEATYAKKQLWSRLAGMEKFPLSPQKRQEMELLAQDYESGLEMEKERAKAEMKAEEDRRKAEEQQIKARQEMGNTLSNMLEKSETELAKLYDDIEASGQRRVEEYNKLVDDHYTKMVRSNRDYGVEDARKYIEEMYGPPPTNEPSNQKRTQIQMQEWKVRKLREQLNIADPSFQVGGMANDEAPPEVAELAAALRSAMENEDMETARQIHAQLAALRQQTQQG